MKKIVSVLAVIFVLSFAAISVSYSHCGVCPLKKASSGDWVAEKVAMMTDRLGLNAEQATQIEALIKEKKEKKQAVKDEYTAKVKALLTDEQKVKYDEMKAENTKGSMKGSHHHDHKGSNHDMKGSEKGS